MTYAEHAVDSLEDARLAANDGQMQWAQYLATRAQVWATLAGGRGQRRFRLVVRRTRLTKPHGRLRSSPVNLERES